MFFFIIIDFFNFKPSISIYYYQFKYFWRSIDVPFALKKRKKEKKALVVSWIALCGGD